MELVTRLEHLVVCFTCRGCVLGTLDLHYCLTWIKLHQLVARGAVLVLQEYWAVTDSKMCHAFKRLPTSRLSNIVPTRKNTALYHYNLVVMSSLQFFSTVITWVNTPPPFSCHVLGQAHYLLAHTIPALSGLIESQFEIVDMS